MKYRILPSSLLLMLFFSCLNTTESVHLNQVPKLIQMRNLEAKFNLAKWEVYKNNMHDTLGLLNSNEKVSFLKCDLGISDYYTELNTNYLSGDTVETIYIFPSFKNDETDFLANYKLMACGASYKGSELKYLPAGDKSFLIFNDSLSRINELTLIKYIQTNKDKVNPWLIEYAIHRGFIK